MSKIRTQVMASVVIIHTARQFVSPLALKAYGLGLAFLALSQTVSVGNVLANLLGVGVAGAGHFVVVALLGTAAIVQLLTFVGGTFAVLLVRDLLRRRAGAVFA